MYVYNVGTQGLDECMINVRYYYCYFTVRDRVCTQHKPGKRIRKKANETRMGKKGDESMGEGGAVEGAGGRGGRERGGGGNQLAAVHATLKR